MARDNGRSKRSVLTIHKKLQMINLQEKDGLRPSKISKKLNISLSTVRGVLKKRNTITSKALDLTNTVETGVNRTASMIKLEKMLRIWIDDCCHHKIALSSLSIQRKAFSIFRSFNLSAESFVASKGWFHRFKKRAGLHNVKFIGEAASADHLAASKYPAELSKLIEKGGYSEQQIFNVDETALFYKKMPNTTFTKSKECMCIRLQNFKRSTNVATWWKCCW